MVVELRELGEVGEVEVDIGAEAFRVGAGVAGEALRERLHLEEEVALPQESLGLPLVRQLEADPSLLEVTDLLGGVDERPFPRCRGAGIFHVAPKDKKNAAEGTGTRSR